MSGMVESITQFWASFHFIWPWVVAVFPLPWLVRRFVKPAERIQVPLFAPQIVQRLQQSWQQPTLLQPTQQSHIMPPLVILLWCLLILAAMRPVWFLTATPFNVSGKDMILAVDLSGSMQKNDLMLGNHAVDRLTAVKSVVRQFIQQRRGDRMGLVVFGTQAFIQSPLTYDLNTVQTLLDETAIGMAGNNTAIGDAIGLTLKHLKALGGQKGKTVLILLTDGTNTAGAVEPLAAAEKARQAGLKIYTIAIGQQASPGLARFFNPSRGDLDVATLKKIAQITGGKFFYAPETRLLGEVYQTINQLESTEHQINPYRQRTELYPWPLASFLLLSFLLVAWQIKRGDLI